MDGPQTPFYINVIKRAKQKQRLPTHQEGRGSPYQGGEDCHQPESKILPRDKKAVSPVQEGTIGIIKSNLETKISWRKTHFGGITRTIS